MEWTIGNHKSGWFDFGPFELFFSSLGRPVFFRFGPKLDLNIRLKYFSFWEQPLKYDAAFFTPLGMFGGESHGYVIWYGPKWSRKWCIWNCSLQQSRNGLSRNEGKGYSPFNLFQCWWLYIRPSKRGTWLLIPISTMAYFQPPKLKVFLSRE